MPLLRPRATLPAIALLLASGTSSALPPNSPPDLREGANHHTGDDGFEAHLGRKPQAGDEKLRMREHFLAVRARLAARPATRPDLEAKRKRILAFLDTYIAKGTTPANDHLPWRTPVFIDDQGTICAVGFLIEQTAGRQLAEAIASTHRYSFIEDIAKDMPEVRAWVAESGFTLDELGQIQPGYQGPDVLMWETGLFASVEDHDQKITDGLFEREGIRGMLRKGKMEGVWTHVGEHDTVLGSGEFHRGSGTWTSFHGNGVAQATGSYQANRPEGMWRFFHASGNLAAEGRFVRGQRVGGWRFYYDTAAKTPIAAGRFTRGGNVVGTWRHFDVEGKLLVTTSVDTPESWARHKALFWNVGYKLDITPRADGIVHQIHQGSIDGAPARLDMLSLGGERIYLRTTEVYDDEGRLLVRNGDEGDEWLAGDCRWSAARKRFARAGDVTALNALLTSASGQGETETAPACRPGVRVPAERAKRISTLVDSMKVVRSATPQFMTEVALEDESAQAQDLPETLAASMSLDIIWPHVDGRFNEVYRTLPGYARAY